MRHSSARPEASWIDFASVGIRLVIILAAFSMGGSIARKFGFPEHWGAFAALSSVAVFNMGLLLVRELQRQGLPFLGRWLMFCAWLAGLFGIIWSAMQIRYDQWSLFYASTHVVLMIVLNLLLGWVCAGRELTAVVFGPRAKTRGKPSSAVDDRWRD